MSKSTLLKLVKKGIPHKMRADLWFKVSNAEESKKETVKNYYTKLLELSPNQESEETIEKDLYRTFPDNYFFLNKKTGFSDSLRVKNYYNFKFIFVNYYFLEIIKGICCS